MMTDQVLIEQATAGDRRAFDEIVRRYQDALYRHLLRLCRDQDEAQDVCQEAFVRLYLGLRRVQAGRPLAPLLYTIARNAWLDRRRAGKREEPLVAEPADEQDVAAEAMAGLERAEVARAVAGLPLGQREVVSLYYDQGLTQREIAAVTGAPAGTVASRLHRAVAALRAALAPGAPAVVATGLARPPWGDDPWEQALHQSLASQATAPASLAPAVAGQIAGMAPAGLGLALTVHTLWTGVPMMFKAGMAGVLALALVAGGVYHSRLPATGEGGKAPAAAGRSLPAGRRVCHVVHRTLAGRVGLQSEARIEIWSDGRRLYDAGWTNGDLICYLQLDSASGRLVAIPEKKRTVYLATAGDEQTRGALRMMVAAAQGFLKIPRPKGGVVTREAQGGRQVEVVTDTREGRAGEQIRRVWRGDAKTGDCLGMDFYVRERGGPEVHTQQWVITPDVPVPASLTQVKLPSLTMAAKAALEVRTQGTGKRLVLLDADGVEAWSWSLGNQAAPN